MKNLVLVFFFFLIGCQRQNSDTSELAARIEILSQENTNLKKLVEVQLQGMNQKIANFETELKKIEKLEEQLKKSDTMLKQNEMTMTVLRGTHERIEKLIESRSGPAVKSQTPKSSPPSRK